MVLGLAVFVVGSIAAYNAYKEEDEPVRPTFTERMPEKKSDEELVRENIEKWRRAAQVGDSDAQYALGYHYWKGRGRGVEGNEEVAAFWMRKAAAQGHRGAEAALRELGASE